MVSIAIKNCYIDLWVYKFFVIALLSLLFTYKVFSLVVVYVNRQKKKKRRKDVIKNFFK